MVKVIRSLLFFVALFIANAGFALQPAHGPESPAPTTRIEQLPADVQRMLPQYVEFARINEAVERAETPSNAVNNVNTLLNTYPNPFDPRYYTAAIEQIRSKFPNEIAIDSKNRLIRVADSKNRLIRVAREGESVIYLIRSKLGQTGTYAIMVDTTFNPSVGAGIVVIRPERAFNISLEKVLGISTDPSNSIIIKFSDKSGGIHELKILENGSIDTTYGVGTTLRQE